MTEDMPCNAFLLCCLAFRGRRGGFVGLEFPPIPIPLKILRGKLTAWIHLVLINKATNCVCWKQFCANQQPLDNWGVSFTPTKFCCFAPVVWQVQMGWGMCAQMDRLRVGLHLEQQRAEAEHKNWPIWWEQIASEAASCFSCKNSTH